MQEMLVTVTLTCESEKLPSSITKFKDDVLQALKSTDHSNAFVSVQLNKYESGPGHSVLVDMGVTLDKKYCPTCGVHVAMVEHVLKEVIGKDILKEYNIPVESITVITKTGPETKGAYLARMRAQNQAD